jgi:hypothetical protein
MRIPLAPRTLAATALAGGVVTVAALGTTAQAAGPTHDDHSGRLVRGTVERWPVSTNTALAQPRSSGSQYQ